MKTPMFKLLSCSIYESYQSLYNGKRFLSTAEDAKAVDRLRANTFGKVAYELIEDRASS